MVEHASDRNDEGATRRKFLGLLGQTALAGGLASGGDSVQDASAASPSAPGRVRHRILGKTGLKVSEIGFGGHSWNFAKVPDGKGGLRRTTLDEAQRMISLGLDLGVNFFDSCTPREEHSVPGEVIKRLKRRDEILVSARLCHKMKGVPADKDIIYSWVDERLALWQTDRFDLLMLTNSEGDTPRSGYWDMSYSLEALDKLKQRGKIRFAGFGCHFTPDGFREAFARFGKDFDVCSLPYNIRHRLAEDLLPEAKRLGLGVVTIKAFARGELLARPAAKEDPAGLARDMLAFVLENRQVDCCICGVHTEEHVRENLSASWTGLTPEARQRLARVAASGTAGPYGWLEPAWVSGRYC
jgi:aryl-alcohol dehydrogenase-like predicted oxidoreductase